MQLLHTPLIAKDSFTDILVLFKPSFSHSFFCHFYSGFFSVEWFSFILLHCFSLLLPPRFPSYAMQFKGQKYGFCFVLIEFLITHSLLSEAVISEQRFVRARTVQS